MNQAILPRKSPKNGVQERRERKVLQRITLWLPQFGLQISTHTHAKSTSKRLDQVTHSSLNWSSLQLKKPPT